MRHARRSNALTAPDSLVHARSAKGDEVFALREVKTFHDAAVGDNRLQVICPIRSDDDIASRVLPGCQSALHKKIPIQLQSLPCGQADGPTLCARHCTSR